MRFAKIIGLGKYLPPKRLTNRDLEKKVDTSDEWITTRTGIKERRIVQKGITSSQLAYKASRLALKRAQVKPKDIDLIIITTVTPDTLFPSTACYLQSYLKAHNAACFDLSAACAGFVYGLVCAWQFIKAGMYNNILVVGSEVLSNITDWEDRTTCILFGDGAGAAVVTSSRKAGFLSAYLGSNGISSDLLFLPAGGSKHPCSISTLKKRMHYIKMRGNELFRPAVRYMSYAAKEALSRADLKTKDISLLVPHQANKRIIEAIIKNLKIPEDKVYININRYGNMSSASTSVALCEAWEERKIKKGDIVVLSAFGAGLVWGSCVIKWV